jgi:hypothetical protein
MKKISLVAVLLAMGVLLMGSGQAASIRPAILGGAYDELLPEAVRGKTFVPSFNIRWEYDDNIYTTTDAEKAMGLSEESTWKIYVEPKIDLHYLTATTYLGLSYQYSLIWYDDRVDDDTDMAHDAILDVRHHFSPDVEVVLRDLFRRSEEPELAEQIISAGGIRTIPYQRNGDYDYNRASAALNVQTGRQLLWNFSYNNLYVDFDEAAWVDGRRGASYFFDRTANSGGIKAQYLATPQSRISLGVLYTDTSYDVAELLKDSESWIGYAGLAQNLTKDAVASIVAGWESREFEDVNVDENAPYVDISVASKVGKKGNAKVGYRFNMDETEQAAYAFQDLHTLYAGLNTWVATWTSLHVNATYELGRFNGADAIAGRDFVDRDEDVLLLGLVLRQHVSEDLFVEAGYRLTDVQSDFEGSAYDRNRFYVGFGGIF